MGFTGSLTQIVFLLYRIRLREIKVIRERESITHYSLIFIGQLFVFLVGTRFQRSINIVVFSLVYFKRSTVLSLRLNDYRYFCVLLILSHKIIICKFVTRP